MCDSDVDQRRISPRTRTAIIVAKGVNLGDLAQRAIDRIAPAQQRFACVRRDRESILEARCYDDLRGEIDHRTMRLRVVADPTCDRADVLCVELSR